MLKKLKSEVNDLQLCNNWAMIEYYDQEFQPTRGPYGDTVFAVSKVNNELLNLNHKSVCCIPITKVLWQKPSSLCMLHFKPTCFQNLSVRFFFVISPLDNQFPFTDVEITG